MALLIRAIEFSDRFACEVRWITSETNTDARRLYDRIAQKLPFITYVAPPLAGAENRT